MEEKNVKEKEEKGGAEFIQGETPDYDQTIKVFKEGDIVSGKVVRIDRDEILVDIGYKSEGVIPLKELSVKRDVNPEEVVSLGEEIEALVLQKEDAEGRLILSRKRAKYEKTWQRLERINEVNGTIKGKAIEVVKGGLILDIGVRGFLPASLVELQKVKDLGQYIGQELECNIVEMNRQRNNVVLSRRATLEAKRKNKRQEILSKIKKGQVLTGTVSSIVAFGAFVDLGGIDGLIHISELSWGHVSHPSEAASVGDKVEVMVLDIDSERERVSLGLKQTQPDPWRETVSQFSIGDIVKGKVTKLVSFGAFAEIAENVEGLIHVSEFVPHHIESPEGIVQAGDEVEAKIIDIDYDRKRISLSMKQAQVPVEETPPEPEAVEEEPETEVTEEKVTLKNSTEFDEKFDEGAVGESSSLEIVLEEVKKKFGRKKAKLKGKEESDNSAPSDDVS